MKALLFTYLLFIPFQIFAIPNQSTQEALTDVEPIQMEFANSITSDLAHEQGELLAIAQQRDIQKLKSQLAYKNHELFNHEMNRWKFQASTLIFFVGMLIFAFLFIKDKLNISRSKSYTFNSMYTSEK